jgi:hypothetical protein
MVGRELQVELDDSQDKLGGRVDPWVVIHRDAIPRGNKDQPSPPQDGGHSSRSRNPYAHVSPGYKSPSTFIPLVIPVPPGSRDCRSSPPRPGQTVPANWAVAWKGEGKPPQNLFQHHFSCLDLPSRQSTSRRAWITFGPMHSVTPLVYNQEHGVARANFQ